MLLAGCAPSPRSAPSPSPGAPSPSGSGADATALQPSAAGPPATTSATGGASAGTPAAANTAVRQTAATPAAAAGTALQTLANHGVADPALLRPRTFGYQPGDCLCSAVVIPADGAYTLTRRSLDVQAAGGRTPMPFPPGKEQIELVADPCGDTIEIRSQGQARTFTRSGDGYALSMAQGVNLTVTPSSSTEATVTLDIRTSRGSGRAVWTMQHRGRVEERGDGYAAIVPSVAGVDRRGPLVDVYVRYDVVLFGFHVGDASLLGHHREALQAVRTLVANDGQAPPWTQAYVDMAPGPMAKAGIPTRLQGVESVVGGASQTGPDATNDVLAERRAANTWAALIASDDAVSRALARNRTEYVGHGAQDPIQNSPGGENACNRYARFAVIMKYTMLDMPSEDDLEAWLKEDLEQACAAAPNTAAREFGRLVAIGRYLLGREYQLLAQREHRILPSSAAGNEQPAYRFFAEPGPGDPRARLRAAYELASQDTTNALPGSIDISPGTHKYYQKVQQDFLTTMENDPYFRYTYGSERTTGPDGSPRYRPPADAVARAQQVDAAVCSGGD